MKLKRIDHIGIVVPGFGEPEALLAALGLELGRTNRNDESLAHYYPCGDASIELIEVHDPEASGSAAWPSAGRPSRRATR